MKPTTPFGQLPLLSVVEKGVAVFHVAQTTAIINYVGKVSGIEGENNLFALSQQLLAEVRRDLWRHGHNPPAMRLHTSLTPLTPLPRCPPPPQGEDIYNLMVKYVPTLYKRLSSPGITTTKGTRSDYDHFFSETLPKHLTQIQTLITTSSRQTQREGEGFLPGELYLFSIIHQACLVAPFIALFPGLQAWYRAILNSESTQKVLCGESKMGVLNQYFQADESDDVCKVADERS